MDNRFDEMMRDGRTPIANGLFKRNLLQSTAATFDEYLRMIEILFFFILGASPEHSRLRFDKLPLSFPRSPRMPVAPVAVPDHRDTASQSQHTMCARRVAKCVIGCLILNCRHFRKLL